MTGGVGAFRNLGTPCSISALAGPSFGASPFAIVLLGERSFFGGVCGRFLAGRMDWGTLDAVVPALGEAAGLAEVGELVPADAVFACGEVGVGVDGDALLDARKVTLPDVIKSLASMFLNWGYFSSTI